MVADQLPRINLPNLDQLSAPLDFELAALKFKLLLAADVRAAKQRAERPPENEIK